MKFSNVTMHMKTGAAILRLVLALLLGAAALRAEDLGSIAADDSTLASYIQESWKSHPDLESMRAMIAAEAARTRMSASWMNPEVRFGLMNVPQTFDTHMDPNTMWQIGLMQEIPIPGKLSASSRAGALRTAAAVATVDEARYRMASMVAMAYYDLAASVIAKKLLQNGQALATQMSEAATAMVSAGMGSQSDVLRGRVEYENWQVKITNNDADILRKRAALAYAIGREDVSTIADPVLPDSLPPEIQLDPAMLADSVSRTPTIKRASLELDAARADVRRAKLDYWPNPRLGLSYGLRGYLRSMSTDGMSGITTTTRLKQDPMISIELSAPLPIFYKRNQQAQVDELSAMQRQKEAELSRARLQKQQELRDLAARWSQTVNGYSIEQGRLLPQVQDTWRALLIDYRAGKVPFMSLSEAQMKVVMAQMDLVMHRADGWAVYRQWQAARGQDIETIVEK